MNKQDEPVLDHEYDGIQELDNPLPQWWLALFYLSIVFAILYVAHYHFGSGLSLDEELAQDLAKIEEKTKIAGAATASGPSEEDLLAVFNDPQQRAAGQVVYTEKCASCHGMKGEGGIGPNLTDRFWIHGNGTLPAIAKVVADGVGEKGMPPWKAMLKENEFRSVVAYVRAIKGSNPPNGKAPQGPEVKE